MSLVELTIVIVILGVIAAAIFLTFISGTEHFNFARRQNELATEGRLVLDRMTNEIIWAGYMPRGGWTNDDWHPVITGENNLFEFYFDFDPFGTLEETDYRSLERLGNSVIVSDSAGPIQTLGEHVTDMTFQYIDEGGGILNTPLTPRSRPATSAWITTSIPPSTRRRRSTGSWPSTSPAPRSPPVRRRTSRR
jgi:hypothetical protein